jgi:hypothetical protein
MDVPKKLQLKPGQHIQGVLVPEWVAAELTGTRWSVTTTQRRLCLSLWSPDSLSKSTGRRSWRPSPAIV